MEATHITSNPRSGKLRTLNKDDEDDKDDDDDEHFVQLTGLCLLFSTKHN